MQDLRVSLSRSWIPRAFAVLLVFSLILRVAVGYGFINHFDTDWYRTWAVHLPDGLWSIYARAEILDINLDYPPLYLYPLYLVGVLLGAHPVLQDFEPYQMLVMKAWPILFDLGCGAALYLFFRRENALLGLLASGAWLLNPAMFFNSAMWGQTDSVMALLLLLTFWQISHGRQISACLLFAAACCTKYQCLTFAPVLLMEMIRLGKWKDSLKAALAALILLGAVFVPFMAASSNAMLPLTVYGSIGKYAYSTLQAANLYGILGLNWTYGDWTMDTAVKVLGIPLIAISMALMLACVALIVWLYLRHFSHGWRINAWVAGLILMQSVFMLTTRMHERYQIIALPFALMAAALTRRRDFARVFVMISIICFVNQFTLLMYDINPNTPWVASYNTFFIIESAVNALVYIYSMVVALRWCAGGRREKETADIPGAPAADSGGAAQAEAAG